MLSQFIKKGSEGGTENFNSWMCSLNSLQLAEEHGPSPPNPRQPKDPLFLYASSGEDVRGGEEAQIMLQEEVFKDHSPSVEFIVRTIPH